MTAFSFLNESRKLQLVKLISESGNLPIYYDSDEEMYLRAARTPEGDLFVCLFNLGFDPVEEIPLVTDEAISEVLILTSDGRWEPCEFKASENGIVVLAPIYTLNPVALTLKTK